MIAKCVLVPANNRSSFGKENCQTWKGALFGFTFKSSNVGVDLGFRGNLREFSLDRHDPNRSSHAVSRKSNPKLFAADE